jgi:hypothetical protein
MEKGWGGRFDHLKILPFNLFFRLYALCVFAVKIKVDNDVVLFILFMYIGITQKY